MPKTSTKVLYLILLSLCWAANYSFIKVADQGIGGFTLMAYRGVISFIFMMIALRIMNIRWLHYAQNLRLQFVWFVTSIGIAYMWFSIAKCEEILSAGMTSFLLTGLVIFSWLIAIFITKERKFQVLNLLGIIIALSGLVIMLGWNNIFQANAKFWAAIWYLSGLLAFACAAAFNKHKGKGVNPFISTTFSLFYASILLIIAAFLFEKPLQTDLHLQTIINIFGMSIISTGFGYMLFFWLVQYAGQIFASLNAYLVPIFGILLGIIFLNETILLHQIIGVLIVFIGAFLTDRKKNVQK